MYISAGFGLLGVDDMDTAALLDRAGAAFDLIGIEHENKMTPAHAPDNCSAR